MSLKLNANWQHGCTICSSNLLQLLKSNSSQGKCQNCFWEGNYFVLVHGAHWSGKNLRVKIFVILFFFFVQIMGNIDDAVPFFGKRFNKIYPLVMVIYTLLVASNFFDRVINFFGSWKRFRFQNEADDMDGFDASGVIILQKGMLVVLVGNLFLFRCSSQYL